MFNAIPCPQCSHVNRPGARFCSDCGAVLENVQPAADTIPCPDCGHRNQPVARFCRQCGAALGDPASSPAPPPSPEPSLPQVEGRRWRRRAGEIACRIEPGDLPGRLQKELVIEEGTEAVVLRDGQIHGRQGPGRHSLDSAFGRLLRRGQEVTALLIDSGEIPLRFELVDLWTRDPLRLNATCRLAVQLADPARFARNLLKDRPSFTEDDLRDLLYPEVRDAAQVYLADHSMAQLETDLAHRRDDFAVDVRERLRDFLEQGGLAFRRVQMLDLRHPRYDQIKQQAEELFLGPQELESRRRLFDLHSEEELQKIAQEESEAARFEMRAEVWQRMRRAVLQERIDRATADEEWAQFVAESDRRKLLREDDLRKFREALDWEAEDRRQERAHVLAMADLLAEYELKGARLVEQFKHDRERLGHELALAGQETLGRLDIQRRKVETELEIQTLTAEARRRQRELDDIAERQRRLEEELLERRLAWERAQSWAERQRLEIEIERLEDDNDILTVAKLKAEQRRDREEKLRVEREHQIQLQLAQLEAEERRLEMELRRQAQAHQQELARMARLAEMPIEAQISAGDIQRAGLLAELARTRELKGFSEEQILAMAAEKQPAVIQAIQARYQAAAEGRLSAAEAEKWKALAEEQAGHREELRRQMEEQLERQERAAREAAERQERIVGRALDSVTDAARAFAGRGDSGPTVVFPPAGGAPAYSVGGAASPGGPGGEVQLCPRCHVRAQVGQQFCANCGYRFYTTG